jgi:hypothetical protein
MLLGSFFDEVAVKTELADQRIDFCGSSAVQILY